MVHPTCGPTQADDIDGTVRYKTYEVAYLSLFNPLFNPYLLRLLRPTR